MGVYNAVAGGKVLQVVDARTSTYATGTTIMPYLTIATTANGTQVLTVNVTPLSTTSTLYVDVVLRVAANSASHIVGAVFKDAGTNAIAEGAVTPGVAAYQDVINVSHKEVSASLAARTFNVRLGATGGTWYLNGYLTQTFGGVLSSYIRITEVEA